MVSIRLVVLLVRVWVKVRKMNGSLCNGPTVHKNKQCVYLKPHTRIFLKGSNKVCALAVSVRVGTYLLVGQKMNFCHVFGQIWKRCL